MNEMSGFNLPPGVSLNDIDPPDAVESAADVPQMMRQIEEQMRFLSIKVGRLGHDVPADLLGRLSQLDDYVNEVGRVARLLGRDVSALVGPTPVTRSDLDSFDDSDWARADEAAAVNRERKTKHDQD